MLIRYWNGRTVDYGIFIPMPPHHMVEALESTVHQTDLSGDTPATMAMVLKDGTVLSTKKFVATNSYHDEFRILDRDFFQTIAALLQDRHIGKILDVLLAYFDDWSICVVYDDSWDDLGDGVVCIPLEKVFWMPEKIGLGCVEGSTFHKTIWADHWKKVKAEQQGSSYSEATGA